MSHTLSSAIDASFGPVELDVIAFEGDGPSPALMHALAAQVRSGIVRLLDFVLVSRSAAGVVRIAEIDLGEFDLADLALHAPGLASEEDLEELALSVPAGGSAAIVAFELVWARELAAQLAADGSVVVAAERIPAPVVNAVVEMALEA